MPACRPEALGASSGSAVSGVDPEMLQGWLTARSNARALPPPVADHGGWRVDTASPAERCRYVFDRPVAGIAALGDAIDRPRIFIKLCADAETLAAMLPRRWRIVDESHVMTGDRPPAAAIPGGYRIERAADGAAVHIRIVTTTGALAASGHGAAALGIFAYDRIATEPDHRRRGLGRALMGALADCAPDDAAHMLVATDMGRSLYAALGWRTLAPYATAVIPG